MYIANPSTSSVYVAAGSSSIAAAYPTTAIPAAGACIPAGRTRAFSTPIRAGANHLAALRGFRLAQGPGLNGGTSHERGSNIARKKQAELIRRHAAHRRTEGDYMAVLLEAVTLDDWRAVVNNAKTLAQAGDPQARAWLAQYLMGKPAGSAPTPLTVVVQQLNGVDPVVNKLASREIDRHKYPGLHGNDGFDDQIRALVAAKLAEKLRTVETIENSATARVSGPLAVE